MVIVIDITPTLAHLICELTVDAILENHYFCKE